MVSEWWIMPLDMSSNSSTLVLRQTSSVQLDQSQGVYLTRKIPNRRLIIAKDPHTFLILCAGRTHIKNTDDLIFVFVKTSLVIIITKEITFACSTGLEYSCISLWQ